MAPDVAALTADYEAWLGSKIQLVAGDLDRKHRELADNLMRFLRGTYYLWLVGLPSEAFDGPDVPCVGDLHVANFGTWVDATGTGRWGVNDLDELGGGCNQLDLLRLATSALITPGLTLAPDLVCSTLLEAWRSARPGRAVELSATSARQLLGSLPPQRSDKQYCAELAAAPRGEPPPSIAADVLRTVEPGWCLSWYQRTAGTGSLGHQRYVAVDGRTAREAKQLGPPTASWAARQRRQRLPAQDQHLFGGLLAATHGPEPLRRVDGWQVRRLAPDVVRIELAGLSAKGARRLLRSMARAVIDVHGVAPAALAASRAHEARQRPDWLDHLVGEAATITHTQFAAQQPGQP